MATAGRFDKSRSAGALYRGRFGSNGEWLYLLVLLPLITEFLEAGAMATKLRDLETELILMVVVGIVVHLAVARSRRLAELATRDSLTGLWNSRAFDARVTQEVHRAHRTGEPLCLALLDLDGFKQVNDRWGHREGDFTLRAVGDLLMRSVRADVDQAFRTGGDEFAVILPGLSALDAAPVLERVRSAVASPGSLCEARGVSVTAGIAQLQPGESAEELFRRADAGLYRGKADGKNRVTT